MDELLSRTERWDLMSDIHKKGKHTIPWDRMAIPLHEWFDNYTTIYNTDIPLKIPKYRSELTDEQVSLLALIAECDKKDNERRIKEGDIPQWLLNTIKDNER